MSETDRRAAEGLLQLGYQQQMTRRRNLWETLFMSLAILAIPFGLSTTIFTGLVAGGPATIFWGFVLVACLMLPIGASLAEISAKYPTSAGAYYWSFRLASPRSRVLLSWINGWLHVAGCWTVSLSVTFGTTQLLIAGINTFHSEWVATTWQTYLMLVGVTFVFTGIGIVFNSLLPKIDVLSAYWTLFGTIVTMICLSVKAGAGRRSAAFAFGFFDASNSGWTPGWSFFIGLLPPAFAYSAICLIASMAEEVHNPTVDLPRAIFWQIPIGLVNGIVFLLPIMFTLPDISTLLTVPGGQPIGVIYTMVMGSKAGGFGIWIILFGIGVFCGISILCVASRATWAFARDKAIPFHQTFSYIPPGIDVPLNAYALSTLIQLLLGLIYLGSSTAFNAFVGVAVMCLGASYALPIAISLANGRKDVKDSPYPLGRWGVVLNVIAVAWVAFEIVLFSMPPVIPVTIVTMNYASVVFVGFGVISAGWYMISGRYHYTGPPDPSQVEEKHEGSPEGSTKDVAN
ncbi:hypothetical protein E1B28_013726 [Marasmius oreades]|uniref:Amino acid transporter n=1 Tax=Marasmius oreades TaxID=181124 RepID=A0A9P7UNB3_9AGAR|nr:uncharacterized protein E1B28_013726 [Marasmius oreades]KAG7087785.1 hypothetical protein E1B28_013726 [Marasmius oreades]